RMSSASALIELGGESYALLSEAERMRRVERWSGVLASIARDAGAIHRLQWIERTVPDVSDALRTHLEASLDASTGSLRPAKALRSYRELIAAESNAAVVHECYAAISVRTPKMRSMNRVGSGAAGTQWGEQLSEEIALLADRCRQAGVPVRGLLSRVGLEALVRRGFDALVAPSPSSLPWPVAVEATWAAVRTDGLWHATFWVAEWPRHEVGSDFLLPLLVGVRARRSISLVMAPVPPLRAIKRAEHARTSRVADAELRRRHGFAHTARARSEDETVIRREAELAAGHAAFRFSAYVTVSAPERDALERSCRDVVHAAALSGLDLRRLYGDQATALCFTLPAGRGRS
ncbi:MAG: SCO6880 family protein, partial [Acidimicrobiales bacterium]